MEALVPGDTVVVTKLDRLARSSRDLHNILHELTQDVSLVISLSAELDLDHGLLLCRIEW
jgi:DNA invertase Pin-like site-specific DNA recombinase